MSTGSRQTDLARLGLDDDADDAKIKARFRELALERHPDVNPDADPAEFQALTDATRALLAKPAMSTADVRARGHGPAMEALWAARRRHMPAQYPAWFRPPTGEPSQGERGIHTFGRLLLNALRKC